jgi:hypothetical protein
MSKLATSPSAFLFHRGSLLDLALGTKGPNCHVLHSVILAIHCFWLFGFPDTLTSQPYKKEKEAGYI